MQIIKRIEYPINIETSKSDKSLLKKKLIIPVNISNKNIWKGPKISMFIKIVKNFIKLMNTNERNRPISLPLRPLI